MDAPSTQGRTQTRIEDGETTSGYPGQHVARKRLPDDVREEYGTLFGQSFEAKFYAPASTKRREAERLFHEWLADVDARIANILAQRRGEGTALTRQQARALAGEWYDWFLSRHSSTEKN